MDAAGIPALQDAIRHLHGFESVYVATEPVKVTLMGRVLWNGEVSVFDLPPGSTHPRAYAWSYAGEGTRRQFVAILHVPGIETPTEAVRAYLVQASQKAKAAKAKR